MNKTALFIALSLALGSVLAQGKPVTKAAPKSEGPGPVADAPSQSLGVNPFTGKSLQYEQVQRELEASRLRTQLLEETLKQTNLREETSTVPLRKAVEAAQAKTGIKKEEASILAIEDTLQQQRASKSKVSPKLAAGKEAQMRAEIEAKVRAEQAHAQAQPQAVARLPSLLGVLESGGSRSAVLDFDGATLVVADGGISPAGDVHVKNEDSATIGGRTYRVHTATISRFVVSDPKPPSTKSGDAKPPALLALAPAPGKLASPAHSIPTPNFQLPPGLPPLPASLTN